MATGDPRSQASADTDSSSSVRLCKTFVTYRGDASKLLSTHKFEDLEMVARESAVESTPVAPFPFATFSIQHPNFKDACEQWARAETWKINFSAFLFRVADTETAGDVLRILTFLPAAAGLRFVSESRQDTGKAAFFGSLRPLCDEDRYLKLFSVTAYFSQKAGSLPFYFTGVSAFDAGSIRVPERLTKRSETWFVSELTDRCERACLHQSKVCCTELTFHRRQAHWYVFNMTGRKKNTSLVITQDGDAAKK
jgi:hypothetical protein